MLPTDVGLQTSSNGILSAPPEKNDLSINNSAKVITMAEAKVEKSGFPEKPFIKSGTAASLGPNSLVRHLSMRSSTLGNVDLSDSILDHVGFRNSRLNRCRLEGAVFSGSHLDAVHIENSSLKGMVIENCDVDGLVINGVKVGALIAMLQGGGK